MKRSIPLVRISFAFAAAMVLAFATGCEQKGNDLAQITEVFQKRVAEKEKELAEVRAAQQLAMAQKAELEGKLQALQAELERTHTLPGTATAGGPGISMEKLSAHLATLLEPTIRKSVQQAIAAQPAAAPALGNPTVANSNGREPAISTPTSTTRRPPKEDPAATAEVTPPPRAPKETPTGEPKRPTGTSTKIPIELPPLDGGR